MLIRDQARRLAGPAERPASAAGPPALAILVVDDDPETLEALRALGDAGLLIETARSADEAAAALAARDVDLVLADLRQARGAGPGSAPGSVDLLSWLATDAPERAVIVMASRAGTELAREAMRRGAGDVLPKPLEPVRILAAIRTQAELTRARRANRRLSALTAPPPAASPLVGASPAMRAVLASIEAVAMRDGSVVIRGERGTGRLTLARAIHGASARRARAFSVLDSGVPKEHAEGVLFGSLPGRPQDAAGIGRLEAADGGSIYLAEIADLPWPAQRALGRFVDSGEFEPLGATRPRRADVRVIAATATDLAPGFVAREIRLPPLRERVEDIPRLAEHFLHRHAARYCRRVTAFDADVVPLLAAQAWPGNLRELDHVVERAVLAAAGPVIRPEDLGLRPGGSGRGVRVDEMSLGDVESLLIRKAMARADGNVSRAAKALGLSRSALYRRLQRHEM